MRCIMLETADLTNEQTEYQPNASQSAPSSIHVLRTVGVLPSKLKANRAGFHFRFILLMQRISIQSMRVEVFVASSSFSTF